MSSLAEYEYVCNALAEKRGQEIVGLNLKEIGTFSDVFIIVTGNSEVHMKTLLETAQEVLEKNGHTVKVEGENSPSWRLLDGGNVVVHVFSKKGRDFYKIEKLWADAEILTYEYKD